jgi:hypothetical protein
MSGMEPIPVSKFLFCGEAVTTPPYCKEHAEKCINPAMKLYKVYKDRSR